MTTRNLRRKRVAKRKARIRDEAYIVAALWGFNIFAASLLCALTVNYLLGRL